METIVRTAAQQHQRSRVTHYLGPRILNFPRSFQGHGDTSSNEIIVSSICLYTPSVVAVVIVVSYLDIKYTYIFTYK